MFAKIVLLNAMTGKVKSISKCYFIIFALISHYKYNLRVKLNVICYIVTYIQMDNDRGYDKIKHLVEIEDDIFAVFTINSKGEVNDFNIAKNIDIEKKKIY